MLQTQENKLLLLLVVVILSFSFFTFISPQSARAQTDISDTGGVSGESDDDCVPDTYCDADCGGKECGSVSGTSCSVDSDCVVDCSGSCTQSCGSCSSSYYCEGDIKREEGEECNGDTCEEIDRQVENCNSNDGWYCLDNVGYGVGFETEYRDYTCQDGSCTYSITDRITCPDLDGWYCADKSPTCSDTDNSTHVKEQRGHYCTTSGGDYPCNCMGANQVNCKDQKSWYCDPNDPKKCVYKDHTCSGGSCVPDETIATGDCRTIEGWYCEEEYNVDKDNREEWEFDCSGGSCDGNLVNSYSLGDDFEDWSFTNYGDRVFCVGDTLPPDTVCSGDADPSAPHSEGQSYPIAYDLKYNEVESHKYNSVEHGDRDYPYCKASVPPEVELDWSYHSQTNHGHKESELQVSQGNTDFSTTIIDTTLNSTNYTIDSLNLEFDQIYYWRVRVTDKKDNTSEWFNSEELATDEDFQTDKRRAHPSFTWSPPSPQLGENVKFIDSTTEGAVEIDKYEWYFDDYSEGVAPDATGSSASTEFTGDLGSKEVVLIVEDADGVRCGTSKTVNVEEELPDWKEISPFSSQSQLLSI